jgi:hypothetical protein
MGSIGGFWGAVFVSYDGWVAQLRNDSCRVNNKKFRFFAARGVSDWCSTGFEGIVCARESVAQMGTPPSAPSDRRIAQAAGRRRVDPG